MSNKTIQKTFDEIGEQLKSNGTKIGAREAYVQMSDLMGQLNKQGFSLEAISAWDDDITQAQTPGWPKGKGRARK